MQKRNAIVLLIILGLTGIWMTALHMVVFPVMGVLGLSGIGMIAVILMALNRRWLLPDSPPLTREALNRSILVAAGMGTLLSLLFGALGA
jgi:hypothetical protein